VAGMSGDSDDDDGPVPDPDAIVVVPITDELDLHTFQPKEVAEVVAEYVDAARAAGILEVRIIHGKGTGALRRTVHAVLGRHPGVERFALAGERAGSWGATVATLRPLAPGDDQKR